MSRIEDKVVRDHVTDPRFAPPDESRFMPPREKPKRGTTRRVQLLALVIVVSTFIVTHGMQSYRLRGWAAIVVSVALLVLGAVEFALNHVVAERENPDDPYSRPSNITR